MFHQMEPKNESKIEYTQRIIIINPPKYISRHPSRYQQFLETLRRPFRGLAQFETTDPGMLYSTEIELSVPFSDCGIVVQLQYRFPIILHEPSNKLHHLFTSSSCLGRSTGLVIMATLHWFRICKNNRVAQQTVFFPLQIKDLFHGRVKETFQILRECLQGY
jgi:hypothetical protein